MCISKYKQFNKRIRLRKNMFGASILKRISLAFDNIDRICI